MDNFLPVIFITLVLSVTFTSSTYKKNCDLVKSYDRLSHDCTSEPECEENCVIVERNECDIVEETECFTTNQKNCEITQEETCQTVTEEECSETFAQQCSTVEVEECSTVNKQECRTVSERECSTENEEECSTENEEECSTTEERECSIVQEDECTTTTEQMCMTENQQVCETVNDQMCTANEVCNTINEQQCNTQYSQQCSSLPISPRRQEPSFTQQRQRNSGGGGYVQSGSFSRQSSSFNSGQTQTFSGNIKDVASVPRVISVTKFRNGQNNRDPTQSRSIINRNNGGSVNIAGVGSFDVGTNENELKDTFLTTGIFQRKSGDSLDGRRSRKGDRIRREAKAFGPDLDLMFRSVPRVSTQVLDGQKNFNLIQVPRVVSVTSFNRNLTQSRNIIGRIGQGPINLSRDDVVRVPGLGSFQVGNSEEQLKDTFLTTGIFQRKEGDSLDGRRRFKGDKISRSKRQISAGYGHGSQSNYDNYASDQAQQSCSSVPSQHCTNVPRQQCSMNMHQNCQNVPRQACRSVPRQICMSVPRQNCIKVPRESCRNVPKYGCRSVPKTRCRLVPRESCRNIDKEKCENVPMQRCKKVPQQQCPTKPQKQCRNVPKTSCSTQPRETCTNTPMQQCKTIPRKSCKSVPQKKCKETCKNIYWCKVCKNHGYGGHKHKTYKSSRGHGHGYSSYLSY